MAPEALARLFQERSQSRMIRFDESVVPRTTPGDPDYALTHRFLREDLVGEGVTEEAARKLHVVADDDDGAPRLTLAGVLLCTREPQRWLRHAYIQAVSYAGERTDVDYQTDARDIGGPLDEQVAEALHFVRRNMLVRAAKSTARVEQPQFGERAVFEALVNAVAHRDYSVAGARVRLHMFGDRLELHVPGALANTLAPDSMHLRQSSRNELIVSLLARCPAPTGLGRLNLMDRRGDGFADHQAGNPVVVRALPGVRHHRRQRVAARDPGGGIRDTSLMRRQPQCRTASASSVSRTPASCTGGVSPAGSGPTVGPGDGFGRSAIANIRRCRSTNASTRTVAIRESST